MLLLPYTLIPPGKRLPRALRNYRRSYWKERSSVTNPPLNAPTGFATGVAETASCSRPLEVWNDFLEVEFDRAMERDEMAEKRGRKILDAMTGVCIGRACQSGIVWDRDSDQDCSSHRCNCFVTRQVHPEVELLLVSLGG